MNTLIARDANPAATRDSSGFRACIVALVAAWAVVDPALALRWGAIACALVVVSRLAVWRPHVADLAMLAFGLLPCASFYWTVSPTDTLLAMQNYIGVAAIFLGVRAAVVNTSALLLIARAFVAGCVYASADLLRQGGALRYDFDTSAARFGLDAARGASSNALAYAFVGGSAVVILIWATKRPALLGRLTCFACVAAMWLGIVQTGTRGAAVGVVLLCGWMLLQWARPGQGLWVAWSLAVGLNVLVLTGLFDAQMAHLSGSTARDTGTLNGRLDMWPLAREVFFDHPLNGIGADAFIKVNPLHTAAHNVILDAGTGMGVVGVALFVLVVYRSLVSSALEISSRRRVLVVGAFVVAITPAVSTGFWMEAPAMWLLVALFSRISVARGGTSACRMLGIRTDARGTPLEAKPFKSTATWGPVTTRQPGHNMKA